MFLIEYWKKYKQKVYKKQSQKYREAAKVAICSVRKILNGEKEPFLWMLQEYPELFDKFKIYSFAEMENAVRCLTLELLSRQFKISHEISNYALEVVYKPLSLNYGMILNISPPPKNPLAI